MSHGSTIAYEYGARDIVNNQAYKRMPPYYCKASVEVSLLVKRCALCLFHEAPAPSSFLRIEYFKPSVIPPGATQ